MFKHTQTIRRLFPTNCLSVFDHFVRLKWSISDILLVLQEKPIGITERINVTKAAFELVLPIQFFLSINQLIRTTDMFRLWLKGDHDNDDYEKY